MIIEDFLPNPAGNDADGEYITLFNDEAARRDLAGWKITDESGKSYPFSGFLNPGERVKLSYTATKITLNNNGEKISLFDARGQVIDELSYVGSAAEGVIITRDGASRVGAAALIEDWPEPPAVINTSVPSGEIIVFGVMVALFFAGVFTYAYKKLYGN